MFRDNTIEKAVMSVVRTRIATAQKNYEEKCLEIESRAEIEKQATANTLVESILHGTI